MCVVQLFREAGVSRHHAGSYWGTLLDDSEHRDNILPRGLRVLRRYAGREVGLLG